MKITTPEPIYIEFENFRPGDVFRWNSRVYMKLAAQSCDFNVVYLADGVLYRFEPTDNFIPVVGEFTYHD